MIKIENLLKMLELVKDDEIRNILIIIVLVVLVTIYISNQHKRSDNELNKLSNALKYISKTITETNNKIINIDRKLYHIRNEISPFVEEKDKYLIVNTIRLSVSNIFEEIISKIIDGTFTESNKANIFMTVNEVVERGRENITKYTGFVSKTITENVRKKYLKDITEKIIEGDKIENQIISLLRLKNDYIMMIEKEIKNKIKK